jgi:hypothetical protein
MDNKTRYTYIANINIAFTPSAPIQRHDLFAGREKDLKKVLNAVFQPGQHAILFGERGVGKTSLANQLYDVLAEIGKGHYVRRINCSEQMTFEAMWRAIFRQFELDTPAGKTTLDESLIGDLPENVRDVFQRLPVDSVIIIDEMDCIRDEETQAALAETIKTLSDNIIDTTLILVGVADSMDQLIAEHRSIERALVQVHIEPMSKAELLAIVDKGLTRCEMTVDRVVRERLADYAQGMPSFTHLLTKEAGLNAIDYDRTNISMEDLEAAIKVAVDSQLETNRTAYNTAVTSPRGQNFKPVLLSCALAKKDAQGFFYAKDVIAPLHMITHKKYGIPAFAKHLKAFREPSRGPILERRGSPRRYRYRFTTPLMSPYVVLRGLADGLIKEEQLSRPSPISDKCEPLLPQLASALPPIEL